MSQETHILSGCIKFSETDTFTSNITDKWYNNLIVTMAFSFIFCRDEGNNRFDDFKKIWVIMESISWLKLYIKQFL